LGIEEVLRHMNPTITEAVILMAGAGSRLQTTSEVRLKPLVPVLGRPLISYTLETLAKKGIKTIYTVIGFEGARLRNGLEPLIPAEVTMHWIDNPDWRLKNGISVLAAASDITAPFLLTMGDHLFDEAIVDLLLKQGGPDRLNVAIDRKVDSIFDLDDAMKVRMQDDRIVAIGKDLQDYNAIDSGVFVCPTEFFNYLAKAKLEGDCSLADGVRAMAGNGLAHGVDIGDAWWQDIDTPEMLARAEEHFRAIGRQPEAERITDRAVAR
jgi:1L-myo-inositol 1-phosphate cytidylyltransferase